MKLRDIMKETQLIELPNYKSKKAVKRHSTISDYMGPGVIYYFDSEKDYQNAWKFIKTNNIVTGTYDNVYKYIGIPYNQTN